MHSLTRQTAYEAITLSAFLMLLMELVAINTSDKEIRTALAEKDKRKLPFPVSPAVRFNWDRLTPSSTAFDSARQSLTSCTRCLSA